jgi:hypothetical protein
MIQCRPNDAAAREYAIRVIRELQHGEGENWKGWMMEIYSERAQGLANPL